jgi:hypothetical protein
MKQRLSGSEYKARKDAEWRYIEKTAHGKEGGDTSPMAVSEAKRLLAQNERRADAYNRRNNPGALAQKLREKADYYDKKAKDMGTPTSGQDPKGFRPSGGRGRQGR